MLSKQFVIYWKNEEQGESRLPRIAMPIEIIVPRLGWSMDEGTLDQWLKNDGDFVNAGDMLFVLEGEKASQEIESFDEGFLHIPVDAPQPGDTVAVGQRLAYLLAEGESPPAPTQPVGVDTATEPTPTLDPTERVCSEGIQVEYSQRQPTKSASRTGVRVIASPRARRTARELGVDWTKVRGSGRNGRVRERDVIVAASQLAVSSFNRPSQVELSATHGTQQPPSRIRRAIAKRMLAGVQQTAPVTLTTKVDASKLFAARQQFKSRGADVVPSYNDILVSFVAAALPECPELNSCWMNGSVYTFDEISIAIAVDTPRGLVAPVLRNVAALSLEEIAAESQRLTEQARSGNLTEEQLAGGTFTITNLGMFDIDHFTPIINLPQTAILGIGRISDEPVVAEGKVVPGKTLSVSLTFDHRVIDGAPAARWLQQLTELIRQD